NRPDDLFLPITVLSTGARPLAQAARREPGSIETWYRVCENHEGPRCRCCDGLGFVPVVVLKAMAQAAAEMACPEPWNMDCRCQACQWAENEAPTMVNPSLPAVTVA